MNGRRHVALMGGRGGVTAVGEPQRFRSRQRRRRASFSALLSRSLRDPRGRETPSPSFLFLPVVVPQQRFMGTDPNKIWQHSFPPVGIFP